MWIKSDASTVASRMGNAVKTREHTLISRGSLDRSASRPRRGHDVAAAGGNRVVAALPRRSLVLAPPPARKLAGDFRAFQAHSRAFLRTDPNAVARRLPERGVVDGCRRSCSLFQVTTTS